MIERKPIRFVPYLKSVIWGGDKICRYKGIEQPEPSIGESWEISAVPGHESVVAQGEYSGRKITDLIAQFGDELLGKSVTARYSSKFPLLIKLIDARDNLSVQVHPGDKLARLRHGGMGKSELWYVIETENGSKIYSGLKMAMTPEEYVNKVTDGTFADAVAEHKSQPGDVFFLPAGRVHAIGAGNFLAEIQESSDVTYRIYDYGRRDAQGNLRELHTDLAKDAIDFKVYPEYKNPPISDDAEYREIGHCEHFTTARIAVDGKMDLNLEFDSFSVMMCVEGSVTLRFDSGEETIEQGTTVLLPAVMTHIRLDGKGTLLLTHS